MDYLNNEILTPQEADAAITKAHSIPSASEINAVADVSNSKLGEIHRLARQACYGINNDVVFIRIGDSTRSQVYSEWQSYDPILLNKINISYFNNADPSQTSYDWLNNVDQNTYNQFVANCKGTDGENTIVEFSMGINDWSKYVGDKVQTKQIIIDCIDAILVAKPKCKLFLSSPHYHTNTARRTVLDEVYKEVSVEKNLFLVDGLAIPIGPTYNYDNSDYYTDVTHLNQFGALSLNLYIMNKIFPLDVLRCIEFSEYRRPQLDGNICLGITPSIGLWSSTTDYNTCVLNTNANYRYLTINIPVSDVQFRMKFKMGGNSKQLFIKYENNNVVRITPYSADANGYSDFYCPAGVKTIYMNLSTDGANYDLLNDVREMYYYTNARPYIDYNELTQNFKSYISHTKYIKDKFIDGYGMTGLSGQTLKTDANNKMKWTS